MSAHRWYTDGHAGDPLGNMPNSLNPANFGPDPGNGNTIIISKQLQSVPLVSAGAETRTLARPQKLGIFCWVWVQTYAGAITLTITGGYNQNGQTTFVFGAAGQWVLFGSAFDGTNLYWQMISNYNVAIASGNSNQVVTATTGLAITAAAHAGRIIGLNTAGGLAAALTLPVASGTFNTYRFLVQATLTGGNYTVSCSASSGFMGGSMVVGSASFPTVTLTTTSVKMTGAAGTTGGFIGDYFECQDIGTNQWRVQGFLSSTGTAATVFGTL